MTINSKLLQPTILFSGSSTDTTITLTDNIDNYKFIEVYYLSSSNLWSSKVNLNTQKYIALSGVNFINDYVQCFSERASFNSNKMTIDRKSGININTSSLNISNWNGAIYIQKIIGYK